MNKPAEAMSWFEKALAIRRRLIEADPKATAYRSDLASTIRRRGLAKQRCGQPAAAVSDFRQSSAILRELSNPSPGDYYNIACQYSLLSGIAAQSGSAMTAAEGRAASDLAMTTLRQAAAAGWHDASWMNIDTDLDPIRSRPDFQALLREMAFPPNPFAPESGSTRRSAPRSIAAEPVAQPAARGVPPVVRCRMLSGSRAFEIAAS